MVPTDRLRILADENIPFVREAFGTLGEVTTAPGRQITRRLLQKIDVLAVRSVTHVDRRLLEGTPVRFVGTATIGTDHVDVDYLAEHGIGFSSAPGSNATSVAEYVMAALLVLADRLGGLAGRTLGVIGVGNVGRRVAAMAEALGLRVLRNDPPLARQTGEAMYRPLEELLACDILTLHVPLTDQGPDATHHLVDAAFLSRLASPCVLVNTSRGPVVDGAALRQALDQGRVAAAVLDVWEGEPAIDPELLRRVALGTAHIAGYSFDGKVRGTAMIYEAACRHFGRPVQWAMAGVLPPPPVPHLALEASGRSAEDVLRQAVLSVYDIRADDAALRGLLDLPAADRPAAFDRLRRDYPVRREFSNTRLTLSGATPALRRQCQALGFQV